MSEQFKSYTYEIYLEKLYKFDLLPFKEIFMYTDLSLFYKFINNNICIQVPSYFRLVTEDDLENGLRSNHLDYLCFKNDIIL